MDVRVRVAGIRALAYRDFVPQTREAAIAQAFIAAYDKHAWAAQSAYPKPSRQMAVRCIAKANRLKRAVNWREEVWAPL